MPHNFQNKYFYSNRTADAKLEGNEKAMARFIYMVYCECDVCFKKLPEPQIELPDTTQLDLAWSLTAMEMNFTPRRLNSFLSMIDQIKSNWELIDAYHKELPHPTKNPELANITCGFINLLSHLRFMPCVSVKAGYKGFQSLL